MPAERRGAITGASSGLFSAETSDIDSNYNYSKSNAITNSMSSGFSFGSSSFGAPPASAPAPFSFGAPAPAPSSGGFSFASTPSPAPSTTGGFGFGGNQAPAPSGFASPAPAPSSSLFGTSSSGSLFGAPAPAAGGSLFGAPAPAPGGSFFGTQASSPGGSLFGSQAPAPSLFGTPAPAPASYGQPSSMSYAPPLALAGHMQYSALSQDQKQGVDRLYQAMMQHKRTVLQVSTMAPKLLENPQQADVAAGTQDLPLALYVQQLESQVETLHEQLQTLGQNVEYTKNLYETSTSQAIVYAQWPTELVAIRRGVPVTKPKNAMDRDIEVKLRDALDRANIHVDRVERMPSPYLWQVLEEMEQRVGNLKGQMESLSKALESSKQIPAESANIVTIIRMQDQAIWKIAAVLASVHSQVDQARNEYKLHEKVSNVLESADQEELQRQLYLDHKLREQMIKSLPSGQSQPSVQTPGGSLFGSTPAPTPSSSGLFGPSSPAPGGFGFGSSPAPASGGLFSLSSAPAPSGSLFGSTPAAPSPGGSLFGSNPAPAPAFGTPAPAPSTSSFGITSTPSSGGSLFGASPAPASSAPPAFGGFASTGTSSTASTPKSKNKSRGTRRR